MDLEGVAPLSIQLLRRPRSFCENAGGVGCSALQKCQELRGKIKKIGHKANFVHSFCSRRTRCCYNGLQTAKVLPVDEILRMQEWVGFNKPTMTLNQTSANTWLDRGMDALGSEYGFPLRLSDQSLIFSCFCLPHTLVHQVILLFIFLARFWMTRDIS